MLIPTATPAEIDIEISRIDDLLAQASARISRLSAALDRRYEGGEYILHGTPRVEKQAELRRLVDSQAALFTQRRPFTEEFGRRAGWTRYWIVANGNGHVHSTMGCQTCFPTTEFHWLAELSGTSRTDLVELAGERACTVCFPIAPVATREQPTRIFTPTELERANRRAVLDAKKAEAAKKLIFTPEGAALRDQIGCTIRTEATAQRYYVESAADAFVWDPARGGEGPYGDRPEHRTAEEWAVNQQATSDEAAAHAQRLLEALAAKRGTTVEQQRDALAAKVIGYIKRNYPNSL
jgi:hypothetical protein